MMVNGRVLAGALMIAMIGVAGVVWANWPRGVEVVVRNNDASALSGVTIHVTGLDYPLGDMAPGSKRRVYVDPTGESHIEISQQLAGGRGRIPVDCYFEAGYSGQLEIDLSRTSATVVEDRISVGVR